MGFTGFQSLKRRYQFLAGWTPLDPRDSRLHRLKPAPFAGPGVQHFLAYIARIDAATLRALDTPSEWRGDRYARFCPRCIFLNPEDVAQPYWKRGWLAPDAEQCVMHAVELCTIAGWAIQKAGNMPRLVRAVSALQARRKAIAAGRCWY